MEKSWIPLISVSLGGIIAILGAYVNGAIQLRRQQKIERKKILLTKLEETYETVVAVEQGLREAFGQAIIRLTPGGSSLAQNISANRIPLDSTLANQAANGTL
jgi:hypothetical protein